MAKQSLPSLAPIHPLNLHHARQFAERIHRGQQRHGVKPQNYVAHPIRVSTLLQRNQAPLLDQVAAMVHDTPKKVGNKHIAAGKQRELQSRVLQEIEARFGPEVRTIVAYVTELPKTAGSWIGRKLAFRNQIESLATHPPQNPVIIHGALNVSLANQIDSMGTLIRDFEYHPGKKHTVLNTLQTHTLPKREATVWFLRQMEKTYGDVLKVVPNPVSQKLLAKYHQHRVELEALMKPEPLRLLQVRLSALKTRVTGQVPNNPPLLRQEPMARPNRIAPKRGGH